MSEDGDKGKNSKGKQENNPPNPEAGKGKEAEGKEKEKFAAEIKEMVMSGIKESLKSAMPGNAPLNNAGEKMKEQKERKKKELELKEKEFKDKFTEFKEIVIGDKGGKNYQWRKASEMKEVMEKNGAKFGFDHFNGGNPAGNPSTPFEIKERDNPTVLKDYMNKDAKLASHCFPKLESKEYEIKAAVTTDSDYSGSQTTYVSALSNYEQSPARYNDIYGPYIINQLNEMNTTWNLLAKDDYSGYSSVAFRVRWSRNTRADGYSFGSTPTWDAKQSIRKCNLGFCTYFVPVQAEWESMELAKGSGGIDVYQTELDNGAMDIMKELNKDVFDTGDGTSESQMLGFETLVKTYSGGATSLYGLDRSSYTTLDSGGYSDLSSAPFTLDKARSMVETVRVNGANTGDLVYIMSLRQKRLYYQLIQDMQRTVPTSSRVGFTGQPELDGVPIYEEVALDENSKRDDVYLIDTRHTRIAMKKAPTYVEMAQVSLHRRGIIWLMCQLYCTAPNHNYWVYGAATS